MSSTKFQEALKVLRQVLASIKEEDEIQSLDDRWTFGRVEA